MYPFERFSEQSKKVLTLAQEEAEHAHHSYIGTEHLLLGLLRLQQGLAFRALSNLGIELGQVRQTIESVLARNERVIIHQIVPTSRVKKVIEISFEEARRMGHSSVGTEHLLLGLLIEGDGIAAHVLTDLGATLDAVRAELEGLLASGEAAGEEPGPRTGAGPGRFAPAAQLAMRLASAIAEADGAPEIGPEHLRRALDSLLTPAGARILELEAEIRRLEALKHVAIRGEDFQAAAQAQAEQRAARKQLAEAEQAWKASLKRPPKERSSN
jgi:ATP-dependent Clp protease ATP-binding subunit ClpA